MNYLNLNEAEQPTSNIPVPATASAALNPVSKDLSDWRNIQIGQAPNLFEPFWMPTTVNPWNTPTTPVYPSAYNPQLPSSSPHPYQWHPSTSNQTWPMPNFPLGPSLLNYQSPDPLNNVIDLTTNHPTTPISAFIPVQPTNAYAYPTPPNHTYPNPMATPASNVQPVGMTASASSTHRPVTEAELVLVPEIDIEEILVHVEAVIPDIDLDAARRTVTAMNPIPSTNDIVTHFLDQGYTKKSKKSFSTDSDRHSSLKRSWSETIDDIPKFLGSYSDPVSYFSDNQRKQSESYINHAKAFLLRAFPTTDKSILEQALQEENFHFLPTIRKLETRMGLRTNAFLQRSTIRRSLDMMDLSVGGVGRLPSASWLIKNNKFAYAIPHLPCEEFYDELRYAKNEVKIRRYLGKVTKEHDKRVKKAKKGNETLECEICCQEDLLIDDMVECTVGHLYCRNCVRTHIDVCFKEGKCRFACVESSCPGEYSMPLVSELLPPKDLNRLNRRIQEENIRQAEIDGLECCLYCPYAVIVDNPDDRVFRCLNPECMKETCRLCKEPNHIPLRCDEVEKGVELEMRKFIEEHVTEAMIRKCPRCTQRFYKIEGCNKMTCSSCGLFICYVCRETINGYDHFTNNERCTLSNQSEKIHYEEMVQAYSNAKGEYLRRHPEAHDMVLRYDPISHLTKPTVPAASST